MDRRTKRRIAIAVLFIVLGLLTLLMALSSTWGVYVEYFLKSVVLPLGIFSLPSWLAAPVAIFVVMFPIITLGGVIGFAARPFIRLKEAQVANEYIGDISSSLSKLKSVATYFQELALTIESQAATADRLKNNIESLQEIKGEDAKKLKSKIRFVRGVSVPLLVLSHLVVFIFGVATSVAGSYVTDFLKSIGKWPY